MALVAYASSDDSDTSDVEDNVEELELNVICPSASGTSKINIESTSSVSDSSVGHEKSEHVTENEKEHEIEQNVKEQNKLLQDPPISDDEDDLIQHLAEGHSNETGLNLPAPKNTESVQIDDNFRKEVSALPSSLLSALPQPKTKDTNQPEASVEEDELEDFVKPKMTELAEKSRLLCKRKEKVKITIPSLAGLQEDSDDEEDIDKKKKPVPSKQKSGLFALLPEPKHAAKKIANRVLVPHTLTKKTAPPAAKPKPQPPPSKKPKLAPNILGIEAADSSDDDDENDAEAGSNFFSLGGDDKDQSSVLGASSHVVTASLSELPAVSKHPKTDNKTSEIKEAQTAGKLPSASLDTKIQSSINTVSNEPESSSGSSQSGPSNEPLTFTSKGMNQALADAPLEFKSSQSGPQFRGYPGYTSQHSDGGYSYSQQYNMANQDGEQPMYPESSYAAPVDDAASEQLLRLQGRRGFGREEINIIDVNQADQIGDVDLVKTISEESGEMMSHSKKKNKDMPSGQQKRKHQITYLAFKAKERELELKNQWATNRQTRQQTQSKYGF